MQLCLEGTSERYFDNLQDLVTELKIKKVKEKESKMKFWLMYDMIEVLN